MSIFDIHILNGPNLNLLGKRETSIYGDCSFESYFENLKKEFSSLNIFYFQSNSEGEIIDYLHKIGFQNTAILLNAGGYTHTSVSIRDAISAITSPVLEIHISNVQDREEFRKQSLIGQVCKGTISGFGLDSYKLGIYYLSTKNNSLIQNVNIHD